MHCSREHVFTNEFDDMCIAISLGVGMTSASMWVTISEPNGVWDELMLVFIDKPRSRTPHER